MEKEVEWTYKHAAVRAPKWVRGRNGIFAGVCDGLGKSFGVEPWILRLFWILSALFLGFGVLLYIVLAVCLPKEDNLEAALRPRILGVCYAISTRFNFEVGLVRFLMVLLALSSMGVTLLVYLALYVTLPATQNEVSDNYSRR